MNVRQLLTALLVLGLLLSLGCSDGSEPGDASPPDSTEPGDEVAETQGPPPWILASMQQPRGLIRNEPGAAPGYVLHSTLSGSSTWLIDREGQVVHTWSAKRMGDSPYLMENGDLLRIANQDTPENFKSGGLAGYVQRLSWDGELLWEWQVGTTERVNHHDIEPLPGGNVLVIGWEQISKEQAIAAGRHPDRIPEQGIWSEILLEVEPVPPDDARIVWEWRVWDHLVQDHDPTKPNYGNAADFPRRLDIHADLDGPVMDEEELEQLKALGYVPADATLDDLESDFLHLNSVDYNEELDQIALSFPNTGELWILDHSTTTEEARTSKGGRNGHGGDALYRWGNPEVYGRGGEQDQQLFYQHQVEWVPAGYPGEGRLTLFNNGGGRPDGDWSSADEIVTPRNTNGSYPPPPEGGAWGPAAPAWTFGSPERVSFFAPFVSGAHRLQNGNTFICSGPQGRFFEVTPEGEIVWEYRNPFHQAPTGWQPPGTERFPYGSFRARKIPPNHPGLAGRTLQPLDPQPETYVPDGPPGGGAPSAGE